MLIKVAVCAIKYYVYVCKFCLYLINKIKFNTKLSFTLSIGRNGGIKTYQLWGLHYTHVNMSRFVNVFLHVHIHTHRHAHIHVHAHSHAHVEELLPQSSHERHELLFSSKPMFLNWWDVLFGSVGRQVSRIRTPFTLNIIWKWA